MLHDWTNQQHSLLRRKCQPHCHVSKNCSCFYTYIEAPVGHCWRRVNNHWLLNGDTCCHLNYLIIIKYLDFTATTASGRTKPANFPLYYQRIPKPIFQKQIVKPFLWTKITDHWNDSVISHCGSKTHSFPQTLINCILHYKHQLTQSEPSQNTFFVHFPQASSVKTETMTFC